MNQPLTQSQIRKLLSVIKPATRKRLRILIESKSFRRKDGNFIALHLPAFVSIDVDDRFTIEQNETTVTFKNRKACVTVWHDSKVAAQITIY